MTADTAAFEFCAGLASGLAALGVRRAHVSPGSRSTPLSLAFAMETRIETTIHLDERSSAFAALGAGKATRTPTVLVCTSGTAAAEFLPAVVEADLARVPMLVVTADRPPELVDVGAPQTIDQRRLYGRAVRTFHDTGVPDRAALDALPGLAARLWAAATGNPPGPVHLNVPLREPLLPEEPFTAATVRPPMVRHGRVSPTEGDLTEVLAATTGRPLAIVAGDTGDPHFASACAALADQWRIPVFADPQSGLRSTSSDHVVRFGDVLAAAGALERMPPGSMLRFGALPTSKPLWRWLETNRDVVQVLVEPAGWRDPIGSSNLVVRSDPTVTAAALAKLPFDGFTGHTPWWRAADEAARNAVSEVLGAAPFPNEPSVARLVVENAPAGGIVYVGSSMPIRDVDAFATRPKRDVTILANRGANGIDGVISAGFGAAAASGRPTVVVTGDLSALHDLTALMSAARLGIPVTVVIVNNDGGGIFHFLPQADAIDLDRFEQLFGTPHGTAFASVAEAFGIESHRVADPATLAALVAEPPTGVRVVELETDRRANRELHRSVVAAVTASLPDRP